MPLTVDPWSLCAVPLELKCNRHDIGTATGFFWQVERNAYLVTNWHVLSGRHPKTRRALHPELAIPDEVVYIRYVERDAPAQVVKSSVKLYNDDGSARWKQHAKHKSAVDVAIIQVPFLEHCEFEGVGHLSHVYPAGRGSLPVAHDVIAMFPPYSGPRLPMGDDLFVLGFPINPAPTGHLPIWKRASVASEMGILIDGTHKFLIDTATRPGMSGSPVLHIERSGTLNDLGALKFGRDIRFIGVYSGRHIGVKRIQAQLGIVWRETLLRDILIEGVPGPSN